MEEGTGNDGSVTEAPRRITRRGFLGKAATVSAAAGAASAVLAATSDPQKAHAATAAPTTVPPSSYRAPVYQHIVLHVNGQDYDLRVDTRMTLTEAIREQVHLTGTKIPCDQGECGACTVVMDGQTVYSCSILAVAAQGHDILTVEGLEQQGELHPVQAAFIAHDAVQCGFCTPGQIMSVVTLLKSNPNPDEAAIRQAIQGNLCRCGTYTHIIEAAKAAAGQA
jgi:xanthine dehydrogenase YagT iron-sulfur-binding subunit